jgi:hypothetical protein
MTEHSGQFDAAITDGQTALGVVRILPRHIDSDFETAREIFCRLLWSTETDCVFFAQNYLFRIAGWKSKKSEKSEISYHAPCTVPYATQTSL